VLLAVFLGHGRPAPGSEDGVFSWPDAALRIDRFASLVCEAAAPWSPLQQLCLAVAEPPETVEHLSPVLEFETARALAANELGISFRHLRALSPPAARELARCGGFLHFDALIELDPRSARFLAGRRSLRFGTLFKLEPAAAAALGAHQGPLALNAVEHIGDDAIEGLAMHEGFLALNGLVALSERSAEALARHEGPLCLNGLTTLSRPAATALAQSRHGLALNGLCEVDDSTVAALTRHSGPWLLCPLIGLVREGRQPAEAAGRRDRSAPPSWVGSRRVGSGPR
jgi:hypothetical protein